MSDRTTTKDLMARLERHYIKPGQGFKGGVFVPECGINGGAQTSRCDALYVGFTSTSGRLLVGHEVKASRADWLHELDQVDKATCWADQCHEWWLVAAPGIVHDGELPTGWGLLEPGQSKTRMKIRARAVRHAERQPSWEIVRSVIARLDTLQVQDRARFERTARERITKDVEARLEQRHQYQQVDPEIRRKAEILDRLASLVNIDLGSWSGVRPEEFAQALEILRARRDLIHRWDGLDQDARALREHADRLDQITQALRQIDLEEATA